MALRWDLSNIRDWENVCRITATYDEPHSGIKVGDRITSPVTTALIWLCVAVDLPGITEENAPEFFARTRLTEQMHGQQLIRAEVDGKRPEGEKAFITMDEVIAHIGLSVNVTTKVRSSWLKKVSSEMDTDADSLRKRLSVLQDAAALGAGSGVQ